MLIGAAVVSIAAAPLPFLRMIRCFYEKSFLYIIDIRGLSRFLCLIRRGSSL